MPQLVYHLPGLSFPADSFISATPDAPDSQRTQISTSFGRFTLDLPLERVQRIMRDQFREWSEYMQTARG